MADSEPSKSSASPVRTVAVIDIGTTSIRMAIAEILADKSVRTLETLSQGVSLGKDTFTAGEIARGTIEECVAVLRTYRQKLQEYRIDRPEDIRVVATSAVREALNRLAFIDRIYVATGLNVETLDAADVHRITYRSIRPLLQAQASLFTSPTVVVEVGGGSTELLLLEQGNVAYSHAYRLGSLRLQQVLQAYHVPRTKSREVMESEIYSQLEPIIERIPQQRPVNMVAMGGDIRTAARELLSEAWDPGSLAELSLNQLAPFLDRILQRSEDALVDEFNITFPEAETLGPALLTYWKLAEILGLDRMYVSPATLRDGLIHDLVAGRSWTDDFRKQIIRSAFELARRYAVDESHARHVAELTRILFEQLKTEHQLGEHYQTLLYVAALLHEAGAYINTSSLHKHSMYIIQNSELFGLTADDVLVVALVARYHRRALPKPTHQPYNTLDRERRVIVSKLAAMLRIALSLDASRSQRVKSFTCSRSGNRLILSVPHIEDLSVEQLALRQERVFFESIFGLQVQLRTAVRPSVSEPSAQL